MIDGLHLGMHLHHGRCFSWARASSTSLGYLEKTNNAS